MQWAPLVRKLTWILGGNTAALDATDVVTVAGPPNAQYQRIYAVARTFAPVAGARAELDVA